MKIFAYGVRCKECALFCPLRYLKARKSIDIGQLLSAEVCPLAFVCRLCATVSYHAEHELCQLEVHSPEILRKTASSSIYRVQFQCADASCRAPLDLFTEIARQEDLGQVLDWFLSLNLSMSVPMAMSPHRSTLRRSEYPPWSPKSASPTSLGPTASPPDAFHHS
jgi:hypothetical protein